MPAGAASVLWNLDYGKNINQRMDVYLPAHPQQAPVIMMVHGGGWRMGDKRLDNVYANKVARWVAQGFILVSINYRMLPETDPREQVRDVARALAYAQRHAEAWGGNPDQFILMGHSAGAHLVSLLAVNPVFYQEVQVRPWLGTIALDSGAMNVPAIMTHRHPRLYDKAFGADTHYWESVSPYHQLTSAESPLLAVCSSTRRIPASPCDEAAQFKQKADGLGMPVSVLPEPMGHEDINDKLGVAGDYTTAVEQFMSGLAPAVAQRLVF